MLHVTIVIYRRGHFSPSSRFAERVCAAASYWYSKRDETKRYIQRKKDCMFSFFSTSFAQHFRIRWENSCALVFLGRQIFLLSTTGCFLKFIEIKVWQLFFRRLCVQHAGNR